MQNKVLIVDGDTRSLRLLEVSLKQAGYRVGTATSGLDALGQLEVELPDLVLADTAIGEVDGFALYARLQQRPEWAHLPFIFILDGEDATQKLRAVQLGVSDFLTKPVFLKEALSRVELLLEKQAQRGEGPSGKTPTSGRARFSGALSGTALLDLLQTMELGRKSGIAHCQSGRGQRAVVYFAGGAVVDAELGRLSGIEALYRILTFQGGEYRVELLTVVRPARIEIGAPGLLMEAMRFLEEWNRLCAALPPLTSALLPATLGGAAGALRPESLPAELRSVLRLFDGQRSVLDVLDTLDQEAEPPHDLLLRLGAVAKLYAARLLTLAGRPASGEPRAPVPTPLAVPRLIPPAARLTPPPLPRLTPPPLPRLTPPPLLAGRAAALSGPGRPTPVSLPRPVVKTPPPLPESAAVTLPAELLITLVPEPPPPAQALSAEAAHLKQTMRWGERPTPPPLPAPQAARYTPAVPLVASPPPAPEPSAEAAHLKQTMRWSGRPTPAPLPAPQAARYTPAVVPAASPPPAAEPSAQAAHLKQTMPGGARLTPPPLPAREAVHFLPTVSTASAQLAPPQVQAAAPPAVPGSARPTPPPIPAREVSRLTPAVAWASLGSTPNAEAEPLEPEGPGSAWLTPLALSLEEEQAEPAEPAEPAVPESARLTPVLSLGEEPAEPAVPESARLMPARSREEEQAEPAVPGSVRRTPPAWSFEAESPEPASSGSARRTPPPLPRPDASRLTPVLESRATPPPLPDETPSSVLPAWATGASESSAAPGNNLARLAQRLAATRQPPPFVAPSLPGSAGVVAASAQGNSDPGSAAVQPMAPGEASGRAAGPARGGSVPELEPLSIPDFELMIEHSAPSWFPAPQEDGATPGSELKGNKTLPVQLRAQHRAAAADSPAVHLSAPVLLPAGPASAVLPPIEVEVPPAPLFMPPPAGGTVATRQRWGKVVAWVVAGTALFSLGAGLYWVRQELDRGIAMPGRQSAPPTAAMTESPASGPKAARPPKMSPPTPSPVVASLPTGAPPAVGEPTGALATAAPPSSARPLVPPSPAPASGTVVAAAPPPVTSPADPAAGGQAASPPPVTSPADPAAGGQAASPPPVTSPADPAAGGQAASPPPASGAFTTLIGKARALERRGALAAAYHAAHAAQRLQPRSAEVFALLAQLALDEGNADKAAGLAKRARHLDSRNADSYLVLGTVEQARSHAASARTFFKKYLELAPTGERAVEVRAVLHSGR